MDKIYSPTPVILIVDDNPKNLQVLGKQLQEASYEVEFAVNGEAALEWLSTKQFDLILLDINMPGLNGFEVCKRIRSNARMNNIPIIFLSAESERESILKGFEVGAQDYVTKPFDSRELLARVKTHLTLKKSLEELANLNNTLEKKVIKRTHQLSQALEKAEGSNRLKLAFINSISHEIRTPMNGILGFVELAKATDITADKRLEYFDVIHSCAIKLMDTIDDMVTVSQIKTGDIFFRKETVDTSEVLKDLFLQYYPIAKNKGLEFRLENNVDDFTLTSDKDKLKRIIGHLLDNAIKFSNRGTIVLGSFLAEGPEIRFYVKDSGVGISETKKDIIFGYFNQGETEFSKRPDGTGLGLSITKSFVEALGGKIWFESTERLGSEFIVSFPF